MSRGAWDRWIPGLFFARGCNVGQTDAQHFRSKRTLAMKTEVFHIQVVHEVVYQGYTIPMMPLQVPVRPLICFSQLRTFWKPCKIGLRISNRPSIQRTHSIVINSSLMKVSVSSHRQKGEESETWSNRSSSSAHCWTDLKRTCTYLIQVLYHYRSLYSPLTKKLERTVSEHYSGIFQARSRISGLNKTRWQL
jgi:hypothetical protein